MRAQYIVGGETRVNDRERKEGRKNGRAEGRRKIRRRREKVKRARKIAEIARLSHSLSGVLN